MDSHWEKGGLEKLYGKAVFFCLPWCQGAIAEDRTLAEAIAMAMANIKAVLS